MARTVCQMRQRLLARSWIAARPLRAWYLLRYHRPRQLVMRAARVAQRRMLAWSGGWPYTCKQPVAGLQPKPVLSDWAQVKLHMRSAEEAARTAGQICRGRFRFLNAECHLPDPIDWRLQGWRQAAALWRFHLHYHDYLLDLAALATASAEPVWAERAWSIVEQWIAGNPLSDPQTLADAWHPYCISRRLPAWCCLWLTCPPPAGLRDRVLASMFSQARFLARHLEWDLGGNHLLENLRALAVVSCFFAGREAARWRRCVVDLFPRQLAEQILPHGEHYERSPMYHAQMLEAVLDVWEVAKAGIPELVEPCTAAAARMAELLRDILHPDGDIPLFGDSAFGQTPPLGALIHRAESAGGGRGAESQTGAAAGRRGDYWIFRDGPPGRKQQHFVILDGGPVGVDHLPAHGHADLLSFEASWNGRRLTVDSGVFGYEDDAMRRYCRSTAAHNTLEIDGQDQCDMWSRFRMGYRGRPVRMEHGRKGQFHWVRAEHNAYRRLGVPVVGRWLACRPGGPWLCVDYARGGGRHRLACWLHFHPQVRLRMVAADRVQLGLGEAVLELAFLTPGTVEVVQSWYCPEFGRRLPAPAVRWQATARLPAGCAWALTWPGCRGTASVRWGRDPLAEWHPASQ